MSEVVHSKLDGPHRLERALGVLQEAYGVDVHSHTDLRWLYEENPMGQPAEVIGTLNGQDVSYAAAFPQNWLHVNGTEATTGWVVNVAVSPAARGGGALVDMWRALATLSASKGWMAQFGAANDKSTGGFLKLPEFTVIRPMDTFLVVPGRRSDRPQVDRLARDARTWLSTDEARAWFASLVQEPRRGSAQQWSIEQLDWRVRRPSKRYAIYRAPDASAVVTRTKLGGVPVVVVIKVFAHRDVTQINAEPFFDAIRSAERAPIAVYAGWNSRIRSLSKRVPRRLVPSGLNISGSPLPGVDGWTWDLETCELLDGDQL